MARYLTALLLIGHGTLHWIPVAHTWGIEDFPEAVGEPTLLSETGADVYAAVWLAAFAVLVAAGVAVLAGSSRWRGPAITPTRRCPRPKMWSPSWWAPASLAGTTASPRTGCRPIRATRPPPRW